MCFLISAGKMAASNCSGHCFKESWETASLESRSVSDAMASLYHQMEVFRNGGGRDLSPSKANPILSQLLRYLVPDRVYRSNGILHPFGRLILAALLFYGLI